MSILNSLLIHNNVDSSRLSSLRLINLTLAFVYKVRIWEGKCRVKRKQPFLMTHYGVVLIASTRWIFNGNCLLAVHFVQEVESGSVNLTLIIFILQHSPLPRNFQRDLFCFLLVVILALRPKTYGQFQR